MTGMFHLGIVSCRACAQPVWFAPIDSNRWTAFDPVPIEGGGYRYEHLGCRRYVLRRDPRGEWAAHYATTCPATRCDREFVRAVLVDGLVAPHPLRFRSPRPEDDPPDPPPDSDEEEEAAA